MTSPDERIMMRWLGEHRDTFTRFLRKFRAPAQGAVLVALDRAVAGKHRPTLLKLAAPKDGAILFWLSPADAQEMVREGKLHSTPESLTALSAAINTTLPSGETRVLAWREGNIALLRVAMSETPIGP